MSKNGAMLSIVCLRTHTSAAGWMPLTMTRWRHGRLVNWPVQAQEHIDQPVDRCHASLPIRIANHIGLSSAQVVVDQADGDRAFPDRPGDPLDRPVPTSPAGNTPGSWSPRASVAASAASRADVGRGGRPAW